ncbi:CheR family methyltransferase [Frigidibacter mobilis]|uniref:protein-glutamate O-methyltransferase n=1 Tax=Frigidibacter mobilis TaxID=1335048 RepID=A0A161GYT9_9RHOB|nr:CheR family methyltransferase [Frigidibacter mobilis]AMY70959.1 chemotaxis protein methyltransferase CheR [Frigidibacter mobilis]
MTPALAEPPYLSPDIAAALVAIAVEIGGIAVAPTKRDFIQMRVSRRLREIGCDDFESYLASLKGPGGDEEARRLVEALTTHTTSFFREQLHYDWLAAEGLPALVAQGAGRERPLTVWSAACSLGSELWSAGMTLDAFAATQPGGLRWALVGTDISRKILRRAANAVFTEDEISGLDEPMRRAWLLRSSAPQRGRILYRIAPELRSRARLAWANLVDLDPRLSLTADVAFLRNVLIYFRPEDQRRAVANVMGRLRPGGYLLTGHSESLAEPPAGLRQVRTSVYQKV